MNSWPDAPERAVKLVSRRVLHAAAEHVAGNQAGFTDPVEELVAALGAVVHRMAKGKDGRRQSEDDGDRDAGDHVSNDSLAARYFATPKVKAVLVSYFSPGRSIVDGNFGWFGESGKCCVSRQKPVRCS